MKAYIYNDEKGDDISITDIPEDMQEDAELIMQGLIEGVCNELDRMTLEWSILREIGLL